MKLYLLRHGQSPSAVQAGVNSDAERPLSDEGRRAAAESAQRLARLGARPALILHSPLKRAVQTAREAANILGLENALREFLPLANVLSASELELAFEKDPAVQAGEILLVGHQPQLGELASLLTGRVYELKTSGLIAIEVENGKGKALWSANPGEPDPAVRP